MRNAVRLVVLVASAIGSLAAQADLSGVHGSDGRIWTVNLVDSGSHFIEGDELLFVRTSSGNVRLIPVGRTTERPIWRAQRNGLTLKRVSLNNEEYLCADNVALHDSRTHVFVFKLSADESRMTVEYNDANSGANCYYVPTHGGHAILE
jgi:hypothetical protein